MSPSCHCGPRSATPVTLRGWFPHSVAAPRERGTTPAWGRYSWRFRRTVLSARPELTDRRPSLLQAGTTGHSLKGGDPAAPSGTATLLRLHPPHRAHLRHLRPLRVRPATSGAPDSGGVTGGVYKAREHIHRGVLTHGY